MYGTILQQGFGPLFFLESYQYPVGEHQYRAFDQLAVRGQQCEQLVLGCRDDVAGVECDVVSLEPFAGLDTGAALGVLDKKRFHRPLFDEFPVLVSPGKDTNKKNYPLLLDREGVQTKGNYK